MAGTYGFSHALPFRAEEAAEVLREVPAQPGVFALRGERAGDEPYLTRAADLRRRMTRLLAPPESQSKRLNLRDRVRTIEYTVTGSEFESLLVVYDAASAIFGVAEARRRLRLHTPFFLRLTLEQAHPRLYSTNRLSAGRQGRGLEQTYGPFPSRAAAERYGDAVLDLFRLRRCYEDLEVHPDHPGCAYGEMKKCMAPCNQTCSAEEYAAEGRAVEAFLRTRGESMLEGIGAERERASAEMEFEQAAAAHERYSKVKSAAGLADELVRPIAKLRAVVVQRASTVQRAREQGAEGPAAETQEAAVFLLEGGVLVGPERLSTLGVRAVKEQTSVGSSLFAQPLMLQAVPLGAEDGVSAVESPELRAEGVLAMLESRAAPIQVADSRPGALGAVVRQGEHPTLSDKARKDEAPGAVADLATVGDHLSLLRRWYYRPEKQRMGEVFLPNTDGSWPVRRILRGAARMALGEPKPMAETQRDQVEAAKVKILHAGREGVERVVPVVGRKGRRTKDPLLQESAAEPDAGT